MWESTSKILSSQKGRSFGLCLIASVSFMTAAHVCSANPMFDKEVKIAGNALIFNGERVAGGAKDNPKQYDYIYNNYISPKGDCIKVYKHFVFMTWYRGGEKDRHVMLSRYNTKTGVVKTIEFPHRHTGYQNKPHIGEAHNVITIGIAPVDGTIHMLYDMHRYSPSHPANGAFADDYFRYSYSKKNAATVPDEEFTLKQFVNSNKGNYKHIGLRNDFDYVALTYPHFFTNKEGHLFTWMRKGTSQNGAYMFARYDGTEWTKFTQMNYKEADKRGLSYTYGMYGDIKFENGKMRFGFARRKKDGSDEYVYNNGFYYLYSDDPLGKNQWKDANQNPVDVPFLDPEPLKISEPGDVLNVSGKDSIRMSSGADWTVTEDEDLHFVGTVKNERSGESKKVHTYRKAGDKSFSTSTNFPGGNLYSYKDSVYLIGLQNGVIFVEKTEGGTNNWERVYTGDQTGRKFRHGVVYIYEGKLYYFLMENGYTTDARPIYLQIIDLGFGVPQDQGPEGFSRTVAEGELLKVTRPVDIAFGAQDSFIYKLNRRTDVMCENGLCTKDPIPGTPKACYVRESKTTYGETYTAIPGNLEAEHYDYGGLGVSYFDDTPEENRGAEESMFRVDEGVDITVGNGSSVVGWIKDGEWLEYSVYVHSAGVYQANFVVAAPEEGGLIDLSINGESVVSGVTVPQTDGWDSYQTTSASVSLAAGQHVVRLTFPKGSFNLDKVMFVEVAQ